jgi:pilus assembly protein Flp/PilA
MVFNFIVAWIRSCRLPSPRIMAGQGLVEYALVLIFVAVVLVLLLAILGPGVGNMYNNILENLRR